MKGKSISEKLSLISAGISAVTLISFCIYGLVYNYMDIAVALSFAFSIVCGVGYVILKKKLSEVLNLLQVIGMTWGLGLFFLNSYPVWADRLNGIDMYGSRGTLLPVITIIVLCLGAEVVGIISCFTRKEKA